MKKSSQRSRNVSTAASIESGRNEAAEDGLHRRSRSMDAFPKVKAVKVCSCRKYYVNLIMKARMVIFWGHF